MGDGCSAMGRCENQARHTMKLSNVKTEIVSLEPCDEERFRWVNLRVSGTDPVTDANPRLMVAIPLVHSREWTADKVREIATLEMMELLESIVSHYYGESD